MTSKNKVQFSLIGVVLLLAGTLLVHAKSTKKSTTSGDVFYIYSDRGSRMNHFKPTGWMGDYGDLKFNPAWTKDVTKPADKLTKSDKKAQKLKAKSKNKNTSIQIKYSAERKQGAGWAGVYWQHPANNWGDKRGGYDLSKYSKLTFWAKGEAGGEVIDKFFIGGITGQTEEGDSDEASLSPVELTNEWDRYVIDLEGLDMSHIIGGFGFAANSDANPDGFKMYLDEIKLEK